MPNLRSAGVDVDVEARTVTLDGSPVALRAKEYDLLVALMSNAGKVMTREDLMSQVWDEHWFGSTKTLDVHVKRLRAKIEPDPGNPRYILTVRGLGYKFEA